MAKKGQKSGQLWVGTSGWMYKDWGAMFYPRDMKKGFLAYLAQEFPTVEVNTSFYHLPLSSTFKKWRREVPDDFIFAVKMSRYITHRKKLSGVRQPIERFLSRAKHLEDKLGPILIQLPPFLQFDARLLGSFFGSLDVVRKRLGVNPRFALEPRHTSWLENAEKVRTMLRSFGSTCIVFPHSARLPSFAPEDQNIVADFTYIRFHGPSEWAASRYGARRLKPWAERLADWRARGIDSYVYFNNDIHGHAIVDARALTRQLDLPVRSAGRKRSGKL